MKQGWIQAIDGETQENFAPKTTADMVYTDDTLTTAIQQTLLNRNDYDTYTHTFDSESKIHNFEGEGTVGWARVTAPMLSATCLPSTGSRWKLTRRGAIPA